MVDQDEAKHRSMYLEENYTDRQCQTRELLINCPVSYIPNPNHFSNFNVCLSKNPHMVAEDESKRSYGVFDAIVEYWLEWRPLEQVAMNLNQIQGKQSLLVAKAVPLQPVQ